MVIAEKIVLTFYAFIIYFLRTETVWIHQYQVWCFTSYHNIHGHNTKFRHAQSLSLIIILCVTGGREIVSLSLGGVRVVSTEPISLMPSAWIWPGYPLVIVVINVICEIFSCIDVWLLIFVYYVESKLLKVKCLEWPGLARNHYVLLSTVFDVKWLAYTVLCACEKLSNDHSCIQSFLSCVSFKADNWGCFS